MGLHMASLAVVITLCGYEDGAIQRAGLWHDVVRSRLQTARQDGDCHGGTAASMMGASRSGW